MDKQEYKILSEEIMTLVANEQFAEAVDIADRIDWRKVRSFTMLQRISDLYKINRRYDEALEILFLAYDKNPNSKTIVYGICELYLDLGDLITALQYMSIYNKMAPKDVGGAILKYKVLEMEEASYEDRVEQLEKICDMSYQAEWAYQLAYMYHRMGLGTKCVETCDQLISWFGNGAFVIKAMELKMLHEKLTSYQQEVYDHRNDVEGELRAYEGDEEVPGSDGEEDFHVKTIDMSKFNTINLQKVLAESMRDLMGEDYNTQELASTGRVTASMPQPMEEKSEESSEEYPEEGYEGDNYENDYPEDGYAEGEYAGEGYSTEDYPEENPEYSNEADDYYPENNYSQQEYIAAVDQYADETAGQTYAYQTPQYNTSAYDTSQLMAENPKYAPAPDETAYIPAGQALAGGGETFFDDKTGDIVMDEVPLNMLNNLIPGVEFVTTERTTTPINATKVNEAVANSATGSLSARSGSVQTTSAPSENIPSKINRINNPSKNLAFNNNLSYESDGQISLVVPDRLPVERQITGQMNIVDVLAEWERQKKRSINRQDEELRQNFLEKTGRIFTDYDESKSDTIIAHIEQNKKKLDRVLPDKGFSATEALSKTYGVSIWDEVDRAIKADEAAAAMALGAGGVALGAAASVAKTEAAGTVVAGALAGDVAGAAVDAASDVAESIVDGGMDLVKAGIEPKKAITSEMKPDSLRLVESEDELSDEIVGQIKEEANEIDIEVVEEMSEDIPEEVISEETVSEEVMSDDSFENDNEVEGEELGYYDEDGNYVVGDYDEDGNFMEYGYYDVDGNYFEYTGYYDADGNYIEYEYADEETEEVATSEEVDDVIDSDAKDADDSDVEDSYTEDSYTEAPASEVSETNEESQGEETVESETIEAEEAKAEESETNESGDSESEDLESEESDSEAVETEETEELAEDTDIEVEDTERELADESEQPENAEDYEETVSENSEYAGNMDTSEINGLGDVLEQAADETSAETLDEINDEYTLNEEERAFSNDEQIIFSDYLYSKKMRAQILEAIDVISLAGYVGNVIITGDAGANVLGLAKAMIKEIQLIDGNFSSGRVAKISGNKMNQKDIPGMLMQLANGALIIEKASKMNRSTLENLTMALENASEGIIVIISDTKPAIEKLIKNYGVLSGYFNARIDIIPMSNNALVEYAKKYAYSEEYKIDEETGVLALHERISDLQIGEHHVTIAEVEEIIDEAIARSKRPRLSTFIDILTAKRYDYEDMIILKEKDFRV